MFANEGRPTLNKHIYHPQFGVPLLKQAAIYGANGAGKSNFVDGISFLRYITQFEDALSPSLVKEVTFKLKERAEEEPFGILIEFSIRNKVYIYEIAAKPTEIVLERLSESGLGKGAEVIVFERKGTGVNYLFDRKKMSDDSKKMVKDWLKDHPLSSLLTINKRLPVIKDAVFNNVIKWFEDDLTVISLQTNPRFLIQTYRNDKKFQEFSYRILKKIGLGLHSLEITTEPFEQWQLRHPERVIPQEKLPQKDGQCLSRGSWDREIVSISREGNELMASEMVFYQQGIGGYVGKMDILSQSDGTNKLLRILPAIYQAMTEDATVIIDEIENSIHPHLIKSLVRYYAEHKSKGQLIFTTHETCLMNQSFMRPDEIWLAEKHDGATELYTLNEFKLHNTISIERGYMNGRFGGIPYIGNLNELPD